MIVDQLYIVRPSKYAGKRCHAVKCDRYKKRDRVILKIDYKYLSLPMTSVRPATSTYDCCSICMEPLYEGTAYTYICGHTVHWWCADQWRQTAGWDLCAAGAHCPECRRYTGIRLFYKQPLCLFDYSGERIIDEALKYIATHYCMNTQDAQNLFSMLSEFRVSELYHRLDTLLDSSKKSNENLLDVLIRCLREHVLFADEKNFMGYKNVVNKWISTLKPLV